MSLDYMIVLPDLRGRGAERSAVLMARGLAELGYTVELAVGHVTGALEDEVSSDVVLHELSGHGMLPSLLPLASRLRKRRPLILVSHLTHANIVSVAAAALAGHPGALLLVEHTVYSRRQPGLYGRVMALAAAPCYRRASKVVAVSHSVAFDLSRALRLDERAIAVVPNPIDLDRVRSLASEPLVGAPRPFILAVGSLELEKGYDALVRAFSRVTDAPDSTLVILGEGSQRGALIGAARDAGCAHRVRLPGYDANPYRWMGHAEALVIASEFEGLPTVALEAAYLGTRVIAVDGGYGLADALAGVPGIEIVAASGDDGLKRVLTSALSRRSAGPLEATALDGAALDESVAPDREPQSSRLVDVSPLGRYDLLEVARSFARVARSSS
ncbi:MAG: glycosyltransferase [Actinobacteria bacterium]|nr:glycosyltransferase [Actinomycetota bacterium]